MWHILSLSSTIHQHMLRQSTAADNALSWGQYERSRLECWRHPFESMLHRLGLRGRRLVLCRWHSCLSPALIDTWCGYWHASGILFWGIRHPKNNHSISRRSDSPYMKWINLFKRLVWKFELLIKNFCATIEYNLFVSFESWRFNLPLHFLFSLCLCGENVFPKSAAADTREQSAALANCSAKSLKGGFVMIQLVSTSKSSSRKLPIWSPVP